MLVADKLLRKKIVASISYINTYCYKLFLFSFFRRQFYKFQVSEYKTEKWLKTQLKIKAIQLKNFLWKFEELKT